MDTEQLTARVREAYEAFDRHDGGPLLAALSEDIEWWDPLPGDYPIGGLFRGKQAVVEYFRQLSGIAEIRSFQLADIIAQDHTVVALIHLESTMRHNGQVFTGDSAHVWTFDDEGLATRYRIYADTEGIAKAYRSPRVTSPA
jgi:uncharacterized protein